VLTSKFGGVRFAPSFPSLPVLYLYPHIEDNVKFKFGGKECPFVYMLSFDKKKKLRMCGILTVICMSLTSLNLLTHDHLTRKAKLITYF